MAEANSLDEPPEHAGDPEMPHLLHDPEQLDKLLPSVEVPDAVDAADPFGEEKDQMLEAGVRTVADLMRACSEQGRRRRLA